MNLTCPRCGDICRPSALYCIGCGAQLLTNEATKAALAAMRAMTKDRRREQRSRARMGVKPSRCRYCGCHCYVGDTCAQHRDLPDLDEGLAAGRGRFDTPRDDDATAIAVDG